MFSKLQKAYGLGRRPATQDRHHRDRKRRLTMESLEGRQLMSLGAEFVGPVNTTTRDTQYESDNSTNSGGSSVVVWTDTYSATDRDIRAQRYNSYGGKLGQEIVVSISSLDEGSPAVSMDDYGRFVVTWVQKTAGGDTNVVAKQYDANGNPMGGIIQVGAGTFRESDPHVATDLYGNFVVSYTRDTNNNNPDVFAKRYNVSGQLLNVLDVAVSSRAENRSSVAMTPDGRIAVAWESAYSATDHDILMSRYSATGAPLGVTGIASSYQNDATPDIALDMYGNGVVVWEKAGNIMARRFDAYGSPATYEVPIAYTSTTERTPSVAMRRTGGAFVVSYDAFTNGIRTRVAEVSSSNYVTTYDAGARSDSSISVDGYGNYLVTYNALEGTNWDIRGRRGYLRS